MARQASDANGRTLRNYGGASDSDFASAQKILRETAIDARSWSSMKDCIEGAELNMATFLDAMLKMCDECSTGATSTRACNLMLKCAYKASIDKLRPYVIDVHSKTSRNRESLLESESFVNSAREHCHMTHDDIEANSRRCNSLQAVRFRPVAIMDSGKIDITSDWYVPSIPGVLHQNEYSGVISYRIKRKGLPDLAMVHLITSKESRGFSSPHEERKSRYVELRPRSSVTTRHKSDRELYFEGLEEHAGRMLSVFPVSMRMNEWVGLDGFKIGPQEVAKFYRILEEQLPLDRDAQGNLRIDDMLSAAGLSKGLAKQYQDAQVPGPGEHLKVVEGKVRLIKQPLSQANKLVAPETATLRTDQQQQRLNHTKSTARTLLGRNIPSERDGVLKMRLDEDLAAYMKDREPRSYPEEVEPSSGSILQDSGLVRDAQVATRKEGSTEGFPKTRKSSQTIITDTDDIDREHYQTSRGTAPSDLRVPDEYGGRYGRRHSAWQDADRVDGGQSDHLQH